MAFTTRSHRLNILAGCFNCGARWLVLGDSFTSPTVPARLAPAGMEAAFPFLNGVSTLGQPAIDGTWGSNLFELGTATTDHPYDSGYTGAAPLVGSTAQGLRQLDGAALDFETGLDYTPAGALTSQQWYGLPRGATEELLLATRTPAAGTPTRMYQHRGLWDTTGTGVNRRFCIAGEAACKYRVYYRATTDAGDQQATVGFQDNTAGSAVVTMDLVNGARNPASLADAAAITALDGTLNAVNVDQSWSGTDSGSVNLDFRADTGTDKIWSHCGGTFHNPYTGGAYLDFLASSSWSLEAHATSAASTSGTPKRFTNAEAERYLRLSTFNPLQPNIVVLNIAGETGTLAAIKGHITNIVIRWRAIYAAAGLLPPVFLLIGQFSHYINSVSDPTQNEVNQQALLEVSQENYDCAFVSIYAIMDGVQADVNISPNPAVAWLTTNNLLTFQTGSTVRDISDGVLLDANVLHLADADAGAFAAYLVAREIASVQIYAPIYIPPRRKLRFPSGLPV